MFSLSSAVKFVVNASLFAKCRNLSSIKIKIGVIQSINSSCITLAMFVGVVALCYKHHITECHNSHKHGQSLLNSITHALM